jgi:hypothetical protein
VKLLQRPPPASQPIHQEPQLLAQVDDPVVQVQYSSLLLHCIWQLPEPSQFPMLHPEAPQALLGSSPPRTVQEPLPLQ